jgi:hypothetical protein
MKYNIKYNKETGTCIIEVSGKVRRPEDSMKLQKVTLKIKSKHNYFRFLYDMRQAKIIGSTVKTYETGITPMLQGINWDADKVVLVYSGDMEEHKFLETVLINRGYNIKVTDNIE